MASKAAIENLRRLADQGDAQAQYALAGFLSQTGDKKEADQYDKMLDAADNLADYIHAKGIKLDDSVVEELTIMLSKNKDKISKIFKGATAESVLEDESAEVVKLQANG